MEIFQRGDSWVWQKKLGVEHICGSKEEAYEAAGLKMPAEIPVPEVREYDSLEEAMADQDKDELDRYEDELIAEED